MSFISKIKEKARARTAPFIDKARERYFAATANAKLYYGIVREKVSFAKKAAFSDQHNNYFTAVAFFPFIGWLIPLYLKPENEFCQKQAKRAFYLALVFLSAIAILLFIGIFFSRDWRVARFSHAIVIYLIELAYFAFCAYGARMSILNKEAEIIDKFPFVAKLATIIEL